MKKYKIFLGISLIVGLLIWRNHIPKKYVIGKYVNNNTESILEGPNSIENGQDTLVLFETGKFESNTWGFGTYEVTPKLWKTEIALTYDYGIAKAGYTTQISKSILGKNRIWLKYDLLFYFEKID